MNKEKGHKLAVFEGRQVEKHFMMASGGLPSPMWWLSLRIQ
jgi:hypothetical protein